MPFEELLLKEVRWPPFKNFGKVYRFDQKEGIYRRSGHYGYAESLLGLRSRRAKRKFHQYLVSIFSNNYIILPTILIAVCVKQVQTILSSPIVP